MDARSQRVYVASALPEPGGETDGIVLFEQDAQSGDLAPTMRRASSPGATFICLDPSGARLYAAVARSKGGVAAFRVEPDGDLVPIGTAQTGGSGTCHVAVHPSGKFLLSADYASGHVAVHRIAEDGSLSQRCDLVALEGSGPDQKRQEHAHAHFVWPEPSGRFVLVADLGTDSVLSFAIDAQSGRLSMVGRGVADPGSGPRHLVAHPDGYLLVTAELGSGLMTFAYDATSGSTRWLSSVPASERATPGGNFPSELVLGPKARFCYVANRGADTISTFSLGDGGPQLLSEVSCEGSWPRHLAVVGEHLYVANQESDTVVAFGLDKSTGIPRSTGVVVSIPRPYCILAAS